MNKNILKNTFLGLGTCIMSTLALTSNAQTNVRLTQSLDTSTIQTSAIGCWVNAGTTLQYHNEHSYLRKYDLSSHAAAIGTGNTMFKVTGVRFGILQTISQLGMYPGKVYINLYRFNGGAFTISNCTLIDTDTMNFNYAYSLKYTSNVEGIFNATDAVVVEVGSTSGATNYFSMYMGSNLGGQTDTSYIRSTSCGLTDPESITGLGLAVDMHLLLDIFGYGGNPPGQPDPYTTMSDTVCKGMQNIVYTVPPVTGATSYVWEYTGTGATIINNGNSASVNFSTSATGGTLKVKAVNEFGVGPTRDINIMANNQFTVQITPSNPEICQGDTVILEASFNSTTYDWQPPTGLDTITTKTVKASPTNSNYYTVTVIDPNSGCIGTGSVFVKVNQKPVIQTNPANLVVCDGDSLNVTLSGGDTYQWMPSTYLSNDNTGNVKMYPDRNFSYVIQSTSADGCTSEKTVNVTKNGVIAPPVNQNGNILSVPNNYVSYQWYQDNTVIIPIANTHQFGIKMKGKYKCLVTDANGCSGFSDEIDITPTNINGLSKESFTVYPNPAKDQIMVESSLSLEIEIYSVDGKRLIQTNEKVININNLHNGLYIMKLTESSTGNQATIKLIKE